jgi:hypothetical protein
MSEKDKEQIEDLEQQVSYIQDILLRHFPGCFDEYHAREAANNHDCGDQAEDKLE